MCPMIKTPLTMEYALLGFLRQRPMHAYEMHQTLMQAEALGLVWHVKQSQLYALITRLEDEAFVTVGRARRRRRRQLFGTTVSWLSIMSAMTARMNSSASSVRPPTTPP